MRSLGPLAVLFALVALVTTLAPSRAYANPQIDEARRAFDNARHEEGLRLLEEAEGRTDLTSEELSELLILRAMIHRAQRQMDLAEIDLFRLAGLDPTRTLGREVPTPLRRLFDQARERVPGPVRLEVAAARGSGIVTLTTRVEDDVAALAQGFRIFARVAGSSVQETGQASFVVPARASQSVEYWAVVVGPGGAPIATFASQAEPARIDAASTADTGDSVGDTEGGGGSDGGGGGDVIPPNGGNETGTDEGVPAWPFILGGALLVAGAVAVVLAIVFTQPTDETQLTRPTVEALVAASPVLLRFD